MNKKILAISWYMPPILAPQSIQVGYICNALVHLGWDVTVVAAAAQHTARYETLDPSLGEVMGRRYRQIDVLPIDETLIGRVYRRLNKNPLRVDSKTLWAAWANWRVREVIRREQFGAVISFGHPWSDHAVGNFIKKNFELPWAAHFCDPWVDSPYIQWTPQVKAHVERLEAAYIEDADAVFFTNEPTRHRVMSKYPSTWLNKTRVIAHGYDSAVADRFRVETAPASRLRLIYTGTFYGLRTPEPLFKALTLLPPKLRASLDIRLIGIIPPQYVDQVRAMQLEDVVSVLPPRPYRETLQAVAEADVALIIDAASDDVNLFLPSKIADYFAVGKPVFGITPLQGATADALRALDFPIASPSDAEAIARELTVWIERWRNSGVRLSDQQKQGIARYEMRRSAAPLHDWLLTL